MFSYKCIQSAVVIAIDLIARNAQSLDEERLWFDVALEPTPMDRVGIRDAAVITCADGYPVQSFRNSNAVA